MNKFTMTAAALALTGCTATENPKVLGFEDWNNALTGESMTSKFEEGTLSPESRKVCDEYPELIRCTITPTSATPSHIQSETDKDTTGEISWINDGEGPI